MPSRNTVKQYVEGGYYHAYNRGVEARVIFMDQADYKVFTKYLRLLLETPDPTEPRRLKNYYGKISLINYCLMPNHFHLLLRQTTSDAMVSFMRSLLTAYSMYFNKRYDRIGSLFQAHYKAALIANDEYLMHCSRYIDLNPCGLVGVIDFEKYPYGGYVKATGTDPSPWINQTPVMELFSGLQSYRDFVLDMAIDSSSVLGDLALD